MKELVIATNNPHKFNEIRSILGDLPVRLLSLAEAGKLKPVIEDKKTLEENAVKKARVTARKLGMWVLADDSGLEVSYLGNEPGVYSARYAGPHCSYEDNNRKLLHHLEGVPASRRGACFRTVVALSDPRCKVKTVEGKICGRIADRPRGKNGFGYDPVFWVSSQKKTMAQLSPDYKNRISHRAMALKKAKRLIISKLTAYK